MGYNHQMEEVLKLQKMDQMNFLVGNSTLSITCKEQSTLSLFLCMPNDPVE